MFGWVSTIDDWFNYDKRGGRIVAQSSTISQQTEMISQLNVANEEMSEKLKNQLAEVDKKYSSKINDLIEQLETTKNLKRTERSLKRFVYKLFNLK